jgi:hypothetical protein
MAAHVAASVVGSDMVPSAHNRNPWANIPDQG